MTADELKERLKTIRYPGFSRDIVSFGLIKEITIDPQRTQIRLLLATENQEVIRQIVGAVEALVASIDGLAAPDIVVEHPQAATQRAAPAAGGGEHAGTGRRRVPGARRTIAVASGKGGVGKSTVAANLAVALSRLGGTVGLLDADIYGPSVPTLFGVGQNERMSSDDEGRLVPIVRHGVRLVSMGFFVGEGSPLIWRGPMLTKALTQFLFDVDWGQLDYLVIDLPPGTGDVQMTLTMQVAIDGGVIVTTPQDVALADVERGVKMFQQVHVPVLGVVENMSFHVCPACGHRSEPFGSGGGARIARANEVPHLGSIPLARVVRERSDEGRPIVVTDPTSAAGRAFIELAERVSLALPAREAGHA